jgi:Tfp pilus assembly protein PilN
MVIEVVPKRKIKAPVWQDYFLYFIIFLLIFTIISYFVLDHFFKKSEQKLKEVEKKIEETKSPEKRALEDYLKSLKEKIDDFTPLILSHRKSSNLFDFLEKNTHPKVFFTKLDFDAKANHIKISGKTDDFLTLGQQLLIFRKSEFVQNLKLSEIKISKEGKVEFSFDFSLNPKLFNF